MHGDFEPLDEYNGDIIRIDRLIEFFPTEHWSWDETGEIDLDNISVAIHDAIPEVSEPYGDTWEHPVLPSSVGELSPTSQADMISIRRTGDCYEL